jgi:hypothetical protein
MLLGGSSAKLLILFGVITILLSITIKSRGLRKYSKYFANYKIGFIASFILKIIPGGVFVIIDRPYLSLILIFVSISLYLPLIGWPFDYNMLAMEFMGIWSIYTCIVIFFVFLVYYISYLISKAKTCKQE